MLCSMKRLRWFTLLMAFMFWPTDTVSYSRFPYALSQVTPETTLYSIFIGLTDRDKTLLFNCFTKGSQEKLKLYIEDTYGGEVDKFFAAIVKKKPIGTRAIMSYTTEELISLESGIEAGKASKLRMTVKFYIPVNLSIYSSDQDGETLTFDFVREKDLWFAEIEDVEVIKKLGSYIFHEDPFTHRVVDWVR